MQDSGIKPADLLNAVKTGSAHPAENSPDDTVLKKILTGFKRHLRKGRLQKD
jgi:hypothetical protein